MKTPKNIRVAVVGGDDREIILVRELSLLGYGIKVFGLPLDLLPSSVTAVNTVQEVVESTDAIIFPMPGINNEGVLYAKYASSPTRIERKDFSPVRPGTPIFVGIMSNFFKELAEKASLRVIEVAELDEVAIPNAVPSAEGAIQLMMQYTPYTVHGSQTFIIGYGRVAEVLAWMLKGLGSDVAVVARNPSHRAKCQALRYRTIELKNLEKTIPQADVIFNTVPAMVLDENILSKMRKDTLIIDLASSPGGTDFITADKLGIKAILAPGLPGKVAPQTAGKILASAYPILINRSIQYNPEHHVVADS